METFIEKFRNSYRLSETDTQTLLNYMEEVRFKKKEVIVHEGSRNGNLYLIKQGIWRAHYLKDGADTTIWFAGEGEAAFSVWGYVENTASHITIEVMCDSIAYCISGQTLNGLYTSSLGLANLGRRLMEQQLLSTEMVDQCRKSKSQRALPDTYQRTSRTATKRTFETHSFLSVDNATVTEQNPGRNKDVIGLPPKKCNRLLRKKCQT